jgi:hypothetical protein
MYPPVFGRRVLVIIQTPQQCLFPVNLAPVEEKTHQCIAFDEYKRKVPFFSVLDECDLKAVEYK